MGELRALTSFFLGVATAVAFHLVLGQVVLVTAERVYLWCR